MVEKLIDIIIPAYNAHNTLDLLLQSIAAQTMIDKLRVTVVNDYSKENYENIICKYKDKMDITEIIHEVNKGCGATRNTGIENSICPYIVFADADDIFANDDSIEILYNEISANKEYNVVYAPITEVKGGKDYQTIRPNHSIWIFSCIYNANFIREMGIRFSNTSSGEDSGFNKKVKILSKPNQVGYIYDKNIYLWTDNNKENRINGEYFNQVTGRLGYAENMVEAYKFLKTKKEYLPCTEEDLKIDYMANVVSMYFLYTLMQSYEKKEGYKLLDIFREYYKEYAPIYNPKVTLDDYCKVYHANFFYHYELEPMPLDCISFDKFIELLEDGEPSYMIKTDIEITPTLSIIIPVYNAKNTINRLFDSIMAQGYPKYYYEVIACDDRSSDNCMDIIKEYANVINIKFHSTNPYRKFHCPSNTRKDALSHATGNWITFIDSDDMFHKDAFYIFNNFIISEEAKTRNVYFTSLKEFDPKTNSFIDRYYEPDYWLHGKLYRRQFLIDNEINFKEDLRTHEDSYFNNQVYIALQKIGEDYEYHDTFTYFWMYSEDSLSRKGYNEYNCFIDVFLDDYLASSYPYFNYANDKNEELAGFCRFTIMSTYIKAYFYYQQEVWKRGLKDEVTQRNYIHIKNFQKKIEEELGITAEDLNYFVCTNPFLYMQCKEIAILNTCIFVELQSFSDFVMK